MVLLRVNYIVHTSTKAKIYNVDFAMNQIHYYMNTNTQNVTEHIWVQASLIQSQIILHKSRQVF